MGLNLYNDIQNNLNESVGDFQNTSLSQPMSIINDSDNKKMKERCLSFFIVPDCLNE